MINPIDELLAALDKLTRQNVVKCNGNPCTCGWDAACEVADRVREWRARGELSDEELKQLGYEEFGGFANAGGFDFLQDKLVAYGRAVERAVRERSS